MARLQLEFCEPVLFSIRTRIRLDDVNYGGHVGNEKYLGLMAECRLQYFKNLGCKDETDIGQGTGIIVADSQVVYKSELFHMDNIRIELSVEVESEIAASVYYRITREDDDKIAALGKTSIIGFDYAARKVTTFPSNFSKAVS